MTLKKVSHTNLFYRETKDGLKKIIAVLIVNVVLERAGKEILGRYIFRPGFKCDGLSVPKIFRWFLKNWDSENDLYNIAGLCHDLGYAAAGFALFSREEIDDIFRGMLREAGKDRRRAGLADLALRAFAGGHWGTDEYNCRAFASFEILDFK